MRTSKLLGLCEWLTVWAFEAAPSEQQLAIMAMDLENIMQDTIVIEARFREKKGEMTVQRCQVSRLPLLSLRTDIPNR